ncbi:MAG: hypothetical protein K6A63_06200, partial [Acholeplasmatales bacterium]|nr:hypothetical protein [Acholeplasmatales bacterium]
ISSLNLKFFNEEIDYFNLYGTPNDNQPLTKLIITSANHEYSNDELALDIFNECILSGMTIADFSKKYNVMYHVVYYKYRQIIDNIKKTLA